ncbi:MAG TPA: hypothetical protein VNG94_06355, partial [Pyrinomonadaceae bacterium]|nr:hypothetical protein [Pyrinomonadaceae bacterium]
AFHIVFSSDLHRVPIESMMLVEASVFRGDDSMLDLIVPSGCIVPTRHIPTQFPRRFTNVPF